MSLIIRKWVGVLILLMILPLDVFAKEWQELKGNNFIVYYRSSIPEEFVKTVMDSAEENFRRISENIGLSRSHGWYQDRRASVYVYADQEDYINNSKQVGWSHGAAITGQKVIVTYPSDQGFFDSLLPHELGHIILHENLGPYAEIPLWFDEGMAMNQEKAKSIGSNKIVQEAIKNGQFIPLTQLSDMRLYSDSDKEKIKLFYAESASLVNFMMTQLGEARFSRFCRGLTENKRFSDVLSEVYQQFEGLDGLNKKWVNYLKDRT